MIEICSKDITQVFSSQLFFSFTRKKVAHMHNINITEKFSKLQFSIGN